MQWYVYEKAAILVVQCLLAIDMFAWISDQLVYYWSVVKAIYFACCSHQLVNGISVIKDNKEHWNVYHICKCINEYSQPPTHNDITLSQLCHCHIFKRFHSVYCCVTLHFYCFIADDFNEIEFIGYFQPNQLSLMV